MSSTHRNGKHFYPGVAAWSLASTAANYKGQWNHVAAYFQLNSILGGIGQSDGIIRVWFNGQLIVEHTNVRFRTGLHPTMQFNQFLIAPYMPSGAPADQTMWFDDLTVATGP